MIYAMVAGSVVHNLIASNVLVALGSVLRGKPCRAFNSDMLVRIRRCRWHTFLLSRRDGGVPIEPCNRVVQRRAHHHRRGAFRSHAPH